MNALVKMDNHVNYEKVDNNFKHLSTYYDEKYKLVWTRMQAAPRPCFTPDLLNDFSHFSNLIKQDMLMTGGQKYDYVVICSGVDGIFNLGGDLNLFCSCIETQDRQALMQYAVNCIDVLFENMTHLSSDLTTIALVQGDALGGGFESALASNVLIAEKGCKLGLPEVLFNLFPGMGAFSLLSRKIGAAKAEKMILSGKLYSAEELYEMGVVDVLAEKGDGELAVHRYIEKANKFAITHAAMRKVKDIADKIPYEELLEITEVWVDAAMKLQKKDLRMMQRLIQRQSSKVDSKQVA